MNPAFRIFISCVSTEFRSYRGQLRDALTSSGREIKIQEDFNDGEGKLLQKLDHYIVRCRAVIHLIGNGVGEKAKPAEIRRLFDDYPDFRTVLPELAPWLDSENCPFSYAQWECFLALYHRVPCYIYRAGVGSMREAGWVLDAAASTEQDAHIERLRALGEDRRMQDFADARDIAIRFLNSYYSDGGQSPAAVSPSSGTWPVTVHLPEYPLADREPEFAQFCELLTGESSARALLIHGPSDRGKSALLAQFYAAATRLTGIHTAFAEFKTSLPLREVLHDARRDLKGVRFPRFERHLNGIAQEMLWAGFINDLEEATAPVVLILDAFEQADEQAKDWVQHRLLPLCRTFNGLRIVLAGKSVPDVQSEPRLAGLVKVLELPPIREPGPWCDFSRRVLCLTSAVPDDHITTLVTAAQGSPRVVSSLLANLKPAV